MIPKDILKKIKPWMWLSTYIVLLLFALVHFQDLMGVLGKVMHLLTPLFYAIGIAFVLNQPMKAIEKGLIRLIQALPQKQKEPTAERTEGPRYFDLPDAASGAGCLVCLVEYYFPSANHVDRTAVQ